MPSASDDFCEFGMLPASQCAHCRERRHPLWRDVPRELSAGEVQRYVAARHAPSPRWVWESPEHIDWREQWRYLMELAEPWLYGEGSWVLAIYDGRCRGCGEKIYEGDSIRYSQDEGGYVCLECGS